MGFALLAACVERTPMLPVSDTILVAGIEPTEYTVRNLELGADGAVWGSRGWSLFRIEPGGDRVEKIYRFTARVNAIHFIGQKAIVVATDNDHFDPEKPARVYISTDGGTFFLEALEINGGSALAWSIDSDTSGRLFVGEYGPQRPGMSKNVWMSEDLGQSFRKLYSAPDREGVHIHRVVVDTETQDLWVSVGDGSENRGVYRARANNLDHFEQVADSQATAIAFTKSMIYFGEDSPRNSGVTAIARADQKRFKALKLARQGNYGGSIYDLAVNAKGSVYAPTMKYADQDHVAALWVGRERDWQPVMLFESQQGRGGGRETIAGPDSKGYFYITGYRLHDATVSRMEALP